MRLVAVALALLTVGCPRFDPTAEGYGCEGDEDCAAPQRCVSGACACERLGCGSYPGRCGELPDGCGGNVSCGCGEGLRCDDGMCACEPRDCAALAAGCGAPSDGCGAPLSCGECAPSDYCTPEYQCAPRCASTERCGYSSRGEALYACGHCEPGAYCEDRACRPRAGCAPGACGFDAEGRWCGGCPLGELCGLDGRCASSTRDATHPVCWGAPVELDPRARFVPVEEGGELVLYSSHNNLGCVARACSRLGRAALLGPTRTATVEPLPGITGQDCANRVNQGYYGAPFVRVDGLEMFFWSDRPCGLDTERKSYVSHRLDTRMAWSAPVELGPLGLRSGGHVLLPDGTTLLYSPDEATGDARLLRFVRRSSDAPGTVDFSAPAPFELIDDADGPPGLELSKLIPFGISCDGGHLLYAREFGVRRYDVRMAPILDGARLGAPIPRPEITQFGDAEYPQMVAESPDCSALWVRSRSRQWVMPRVACP